MALRYKKCGRCNNKKSHSEFDRHSGTKRKGTAMTLNPDFQHTIRLTAAIEEIIAIVEDRSDDFTMDELVEKLEDIIETYKSFYLSDDDIRLLEEEEN